MRLALSAIVATLVGATAVAQPITVDGGVPDCVRPEVIRAGLHSRVSATGNERVRLLRRGDGRLQVALLRDGVQVASRSLRLNFGECRALERTAILLLASWWNLPTPATRPVDESRSGAVQPPTTAPPASVTRSEPPAPTRAGPRAVRPKVTAANEALPSNAPPPPLLQANIDPVELAQKSPLPLSPEDPASARTTEDSVAARETAPPLLEAIPSISDGAISVNPTNPNHPSAPNPLALAIVLRGQVQYDGTPGWGGHLLADAGRLAGPGGFLDVGMEGPRRTEVAPGRIVLSPGFGSVGGRWTFLSEGTSFTVSAGLRLFRIEAAAEGFDTNGQATLLAPAILMGAEVRFRLSQNLFASAAVHGWSRLQEERLTIQGLGVAQTLRPFGAAMTAGIGWTFR